MLAKAVRSHVAGTEREAGRNFQNGTISGEWVQREVCGAPKAQDPLLPFLLSSSLVHPLIHSLHEP